MEKKRKEKEEKEREKEKEGKKYECHEGFYGFLVEEGFIDGPDSSCFL